MKIKGNYVLIKVFEIEEKTPSGIYLPDQTRRSPGILGEVIAVGEGTYHETFKVDPKTQEVARTWKLIPIDKEIQPGKKVVYPKWAGYEIDLDGEKYMMIREHDILAVVEE